MSPYIVAGYVIALSVIALYGATLIVRVRAARRRLGVVDAVERARREATDAPSDSP